VGGRDEDRGGKAQGLSGRLLSMNAKLLPSPCMSVNLLRPTHMTVE
jgi:hypothetical protein